MVLEGVWQLLQSSPICFVGLDSGSGSGFGSAPSGSYIVGGSVGHVMDVDSEPGLEAGEVA